MLRVLHTSDWHLGHVLHEHDRGPEHDAFLAWLLDQLVERAVDALLIAGDVFDTANPPAAAQQRWYRFLADAKRRAPRLDVVVIGGNHDSAARLDAPRDVLDGFGVRIVGGVPRVANDDYDLDRLVVPLHGPDGAVAAWVAAVPFLRPSDLPRDEGADDALIAGVRTLYAQVIDHARARQQPSQALLAMGHCYMTGTALSELSERKILGGNQHALPVDIFPDDVAYVALGHLHLPQHVGAKHVRYSGSPIPLSLSERTYRHQVVVADLEGARLVSHEAVPIPRTADILRIPGEHPAELPDVLTALAALDHDDRQQPRATWPYVEVLVRLGRPEPTLRRQLDDALAKKAVRLARVGAVYTGVGGALGDGEVRDDLRDLDVEDVFRRLWGRRHEQPPGAAELSALHELIDAANAEEGA